MTTFTLPDRVLDVEVPDELLADHPVEAEGRRRDDVRMLVASRSTAWWPTPGPPTSRPSSSPATCSW